MNKVVSNAAVIKMEIRFKERSNPYFGRLEKVG